MRSDRAALLSTSQIHHETLADGLKIAVAKIPGTERPIGVVHAHGLVADTHPVALPAAVRTIAQERDTPDVAG